MVWFKVDDSFYDHPKAEDLSDSAVALWARAGSYCARHLTDGFVSHRKAARMCDNPESAISELVAAGLWEKDADGYRFHDWRERHLAGTRPRTSISSFVKAAVFDRDGRQCVICGASEDLTLDHIYPWFLGGPSTVENLRVLCRSCNSSKGARVL